MKKLIIPIRLPELRNLNVEVPHGSVPRSIVMSLEKASGLLINANAGGKQAVREVLNVIMECTAEEDEKGEVRAPIIDKRHFRVCQSMEIIDEEKLEYIGSAPTMQSGVLLHVFEIIPKDEREAGKYCSNCGRSVKTWYGPDEGPCKCPYPYPPTT